MTERLRAPVDVASIAVVRVVFGLVMLGGALRTLGSGWVEELFLRPRFFFKYECLAWVGVPPAWGLYALFGVMATSALFVALGLFYRVSLLVFGLCFAWVQLMDAANYLNHYYLVVLMVGLLLCVPANGQLSLDALRRADLRRETVPAWMLWLLRGQIAVVYLHAALAKAQGDWLLAAQPLSLWLTARTDTPVLGSLFALRETAYVMSWAGFLYDLLIVPALLWRRTRPLAYGAVLVFHTLTHVLFDIGLFPFLMTTFTLLFFAPDWPRRWLPARWFLVGPVAHRGPSRSWPLRIAAIHLALQLVLPLRHFALPGDVLWSEEGMRYAWKVMVREKHGSVTFTVRDPATGRRVHVNPLDHLEPRQYSEMSGQPALIAQFARHLQALYAGRGVAGAEVRAEALVSLNGRPAALLLDPTVDLAAADEAALSAAITPRPSGGPLPARSVPVALRSPR